MALLFQVPANSMTIVFRTLKETSECLLCLIICKNFSVRAVHIIMSLIAVLCKAIVTVEKKQEIFIHLELVRRNYSKN